MTTYHVEIDRLVLQGAAKLAHADRDGILAMFDRLELLSHDPRPVGAFPYGPNAVRLQVGLYRMMTEIDDETHTVRVTHIGRA